jgi:Cytochrome c3
MLRLLASVALALPLIGMVLARPLWSRQPVELVAREDDKGKADTKALKLPAWWPANDPLPIAKTNCVRCHLTAGRELTVPLREFARSVHDLVKLSCNDCHGGDIKNDATAHDHDHGFIGTKLSAHMAACAGCHTNEARGLSKGKHYWDLSKGINKKYPVCVDCHGNHDIGKPPPEFSLTNVCTDCHKQFDKDYPQAAAVVSENDHLWKVLREVHAKTKNASDPTPAQFQREVDRVRATTARLMHRAAQVTPEEAHSLNERVHKLCAGMEAWLKNQK